MTRIARKRARQRGAGPRGEAAAQWADLVAALARDEAGPGGQALVDVLGELQALRQNPPPRVVVVIDEVDVLTAEGACGPLRAELARLLCEQRRGPGVALVLAGSWPTATWIT
jgi:hypothetical protein